MILSLPFGNNSIVRSQDLEVCLLELSVSQGVKKKQYGNSNWCQACVHCIEGVRISESSLWEYCYWNWGIDLSHRKSM